jgi:hypothetical protein
MSVTLCNKKPYMAVQFIIIALVEEKLLNFSSILTPYLSLKTAVFEETKTK